MKVQMLKQWMLMLFLLGTVACGTWAGNPPGFGGDGGSKEPNPGGDNPNPTPEPGEDEAAVMFVAQGVSKCHQYN